ncbi:hypothetical protein FRB99_005434 [Tulasnella sp. 403]|nr:hypothetical protein FRB99_005434 [Tulasnella sp. 403]
MSLIEAFRNFSASEDKDSAPSPPSTATTPNPPSANLLYFPTSLRFGEVRALPGPDEVEYPPWDLADKLVEAYFEKFHHTLPVLDQRSFRSKYQRLMDARRRAEEAGDASMGTTKSDAGFICVVFAVYAVAARFVDDDRLKLGDTEDGGEETGGMGMVYYERALVLYYIGAAATQLAHVQAFVLLSSFLASLNCLPQAWLLCGQAVRIAQDLGLHRSPKHLVMSPINKETRRKVWWCVYGLDRMLAVALGRPLGVEDSDCDVELPLPIDDVDLPTHFQMLANAGASPSIRDLPGPETEKTTMTLMAGFNALTQLYIIVGRVLRTVYAVDAIDACKESQERTQRQVAQLDKELMDWCERLPSTFKSDPKSPQQISLGAVLCSSYYSALITLHRNFLPTKRKGVPNPNWASVPKAVFASRSCILLSLTTKDSIPRSHHLAFFVQALFGAAVIILLCARFATVESAARTASDEVNTALVCLGALEGAWPGAKKCREMLEELVEATRRDMKVQVPGVGRPGSVNGLVAPTPPGVDKVQTVYQSYKRAANEGGEMMDEPGDIGEEKPSRKIKAKPRRSVSTTRRRFSESSGSPASGSASVSASGSVVGQGDAEMDYLVQDQPTDGYQTVSGAPNFAMTQAANSGYPSSLAMSAPIDASSPQALMNIGPTATSDLIVDEWFASGHEPPRAGTSCFISGRSETVFDVFTKVTTKTKQKRVFFPSPPIKRFVTTDQKNLLDATTHRLNLISFVIPPPIKAVMSAIRSSTSLTTLRRTPSSSQLYSSPYPTIATTTAMKAFSATTTTAPIAVLRDVTETRLKTRHSLFSTSKSSLGATGATVPRRPFGQITQLTAVNVDADIDAWFADLRKNAFKARACEDAHDVDPKRDVLQALEDAVKLVVQIQEVHSEVCAECNALLHTLRHIVKLIEADYSNATWFDRPVPVAVTQTLRRLKNWGRTVMRAPKTTGVTSSEVQTFTQKFQQITKTIQDDSS